MFLTVRNRHTKPFIGMYDGKEYVFPPGKELTIDAYVARHLRRQSIFRDNPVTGEQEYKLAIIEDGDPVDEVDALPRETLDRSDMDLPRVEYQDTGIRTGVPTSRPPAERLGSLPR